MTQWSTCQHFKMCQAAMPLQKEDLGTKEWATNGLEIEPLMIIYGNPQLTRIGHLFVRIVVVFYFPTFWGMTIGC